MASSSASPPRPGAQPDKASKRATPKHNGSRPRGTTLRARATAHRPRTRPWRPMPRAARVDPRGHRRPHRQACRRGDRTRPRGPQPDADAHRSPSGTPGARTLPAGDVRLGAPARGDLTADRQPFRRLADDGRVDVRVRLVAAIRHRARAPCDRSRCPDGGARSRRLLPPCRRDPSLPPRRQRSAQRRVRRGHLAGG